jgi:hypothetical protein
MYATAIRSNDSRLLAEFKSVTGGSGGDITDLGSLDSQPT